MGSAAAAGIVAQAAFWGLLLVGFASSEFSTLRITFFLFLRLAGLIGSPYVPYWLPFSSYVAILDIVLVFQIAKGDVKLS